MTTERPPAEVRCNAELGPLPEMGGELWELRTPRGKPPFRYFRAEDMRAYALQEVAAERERIFGHIRGAMGRAEAGYDDVAWRLLASLVGPN